MTEPLNTCKTGLESTAPFGPGTDGFTYTNAFDSGQEKFCVHSNESETNVEAKCIGPAGYIRDIWPAGDYRAGINDLLDGRWLDAATENVGIRVQTFNPQTVSFTFVDIVFEITGFYHAIPAIAVQSFRPRPASSALGAGASWFTDQPFAGYYAFIYITLLVYFFIMVLVQVEIALYAHRLHKRGRSVFDSFTSARNRFDASVDMGLGYQLAQTRAHVYLVDTVQLLMLTTYIILDAIYSADVSRILTEKGSPVNQKFVDLRPMANSQLNVDAYESFLLLFFICRCITFVAYQFEWLAIRFRRLRAILTAFVALMFITANIIFAFAQLYQRLADAAGKFTSSFFGSVLLLTEVMLGVFHNEFFTFPIGASARIIALSTIFDFLFYVLGHLTISSLAIAILGEAFADSSEVITRQKMRRVSIMLVLHANILS